jgi:hypothetical protein
VSVRLEPVLFAGLCLPGYRRRACSENCEGGLLLRGRGLVGTILTMTMLIFTAFLVTREIERNPGEPACDADYAASGAPWIKSTLGPDLRISHRQGRGKGAI